MRVASLAHRVGHDARLASVADDRIAHHNAEPRAHGYVRVKANAQVRASALGHDRAHCFAEPIILVDMDHFGVLNLELGVARAHPVRILQDHVLTRFMVGVTPLREVAERVEV